ncbi:MAG TPA: hypothetical protein VK203_10725 [Nostocaceae cyanobacterium]|nr:hypothetical protein [Nostocaceae cyanobacterium]
MMKISLPIPVYILLFLSILAIGGWWSRNYILAASYFMRFQNAQTDEAKCMNLLQVLRVSPHTNLNSVIQQTYPNRKYQIRRGTMLWSEYAVVELEQTAESNLEVVLLKKDSNGNFQVLYSCGKFLG